MFTPKRCARLASANCRLRRGHAAGSMKLTPNAISHAAWPWWWTRPSCSVSPASRRAGECLGFVAGAIPTAWRSFRKCRPVASPVSKSQPPKAPGYCRLTAPRAQPLLIKWLLRSSRRKSVLPNVAQTSESAVSPTSKSAAVRIHARIRVLRRLRRLGNRRYEGWKPALRLQLTPRDLGTRPGIDILAPSPGGCQK